MSIINFMLDWVEHRQFYNLETLYPLGIFLKYIPYFLSWYLEDWSLLRRFFEVPTHGVQPIVFQLLFLRKFRVHFLIGVILYDLVHDVRVSRGAKIRNRYNQVLYLVQDTVSSGCELPVSFCWGNMWILVVVKGYSLYVLSVINSNYIGLIFHLFT